MNKLYILFAFLGCILALVLHVPLAWFSNGVIQKYSFEKIDASGTLWEGHLWNLQDLGNVHIKLDIKNYLENKLPISFKTISSSMVISGDASQTQFKNINFIGQMSKLPSRDGRLQDLKGQVEINFDEFFWEEQVCISSKGDFSTNFLMKNALKWNWAGPLLSGQITCDNGEIVSRLIGEEDNQTITADIRLSLNGNYSLKVRVETLDPYADLVLPLFGFEKVDSDYRLSEQGTWL